MEDFNGLEPRLQALEALAEQIQADKAQATQEKNLQSILDQYGLQFNGRRDVGMEILNQLNRQGVDVSAASSNAIQDIITDMQAQISQLYDDFNQKRQEMDQVQQEAAQLADQINKIDETVANATDSENQPDANIEPPAPEMPSAEPAPAATDMAPPAPEDQMMPPEAAAPEMPPAEPVPATEPVPPAADPNAVMSDVRVKNVETPNPMGNQQGFFIKKTDKVNVAPSPDILSDQRVKEVHTPTFGRHLISVASRGF